MHSESKWVECIKIGEVIFCPYHCLDKFFIFSPLPLRTNVVMNYSEVETKVREATNDEAWGPHGTILQELAKYTFTYEHFPEVRVYRCSVEEKITYRR